MTKGPALETTCRFSDISLLVFASGLNSSCLSLHDAVMIHGRINNMFPLTAAGIQCGQLWPPSTWQAIVIHAMFSRLQLLRKEVVTVSVLLEVWHRESGNPNLRPIAESGVHAYCCRLLHSSCLSTATGLLS